MLSISTRIRSDLGLYRFLIILLLLLAAALRLWGLDRDPPPYDILPDAAPWTDEGTIGLPAVQAARGDIPLDAALSDGSRPVQRLILYGAFRALGPGRSQGRLVSALFGIVGLAALAALGQDLWAGAGPLLVLIIAGTGFFFVAYDRLLLTEGPLVALLALLTLAGVRARSRLVAFLLGIGLAILAVGFKLHALALFTALGALYALRHRRLLVPFAVGGAVVLVAWRFLFIPVSAPSYTAYLGDRFGGEQLGLVSFREALGQVAILGLPAYFLPYQIPLLLLSSVEVLAFLVSPRQWLRNSSAVAMVALVWLVAVLLADSAFRYLPPRYFHLASPALVLLAVCGARRLWQSIPFPHASPVVQLVASVGVAGLILSQTLAALHIFRTPDEWIAATGIALAYALFATLSGGAAWGVRLRAPVLAGLLFCQLVTQGDLFARGIAASQPKLAEAGSAMAATLPPGAVITGRLAGTVALSEPLHGVPALNSISLGGLKALAQQDGQVWVLVLQNDEFRVDPRAWPYLTQQAAFPIDYSSDQRSLHLYQFNSLAALR
jgi:hypothetical protein